jgi:hypothetical protein
MVMEGDKVHIWPHVRFFFMQRYGSRSGQDLPWIPFLLAYLPFREISRLLPELD